ncbi:MFS transporter [Peterkaempfera bronchialis]|uniref:MFS transporter n=1 Tax=Peterkaempfera bronchialis TaxID=2126346 RepID=A0A345T582_9ACTN|nr:MFS transporter [Peterkaempfera bronchialis]AXI81137.1 MFS transporter [Peterkaempfera bronchialis]
MPSAWSPLRLALTAFFTADGFVFAGWVVRVPAIKEQVHASPGALGLALLCISAGAVATMAVVGRLCVRHGTRPVTVASALLLSLVVALPAHAHSVATLGAALLLFGAGYGALNVAMNSAAVEVGAALRRPIMPTFHAAYSLGGLCGAGLGGLLASRLTPAWHLGLIALVGLAVTATAGTVLLRSPAPGRPQPQDAQGARPAAPRGGDRGRRVGLLVVLLGLTALCTSYGEGALADWATLHLTDDLHTGAGLAAAGYAAYAFAMTTGRLTGTWLSMRLGPTRVMAGGGLLACAGMLTAALAPSVPLVLGGFVLVGLGLANTFPLAIARAGTLAGPQGVATASTLGYGGMLIGPPVIGFLANAFGLPLALTTVAALAAVAAAIAVSTDRRPAAHPGS